MVEMGYKRFSHFHSWLLLLLLLLFLDLIVVVVAT